MIKAFIRKTALLFLGVVLLSSYFVPVNALSSEQKKLIQNGVYYYNLDACSSLSNGGQQSDSAPIDGSVYMMGDSITAGAKNDLEKEFRSANIDVSQIDGVGSRSFVSKGEGQTNGLEAIDKDIDNIKKSGVVILALGTNGEDANGKSSIFAKNAKKALEKIRDPKDGNPNAKVYWVNIFAESPPIKHKSDYNKVINGLDNVTVINMDKENIPLDDKVHPTSAGYKKYAKSLVSSLDSKGATSKEADRASGNSELDGFKLPATKGGTGLETAITPAGNLVTGSEKVTFSNHASKGEEYRDYYVTMRWNYTKWNWNGTTSGVDNKQFNWFKEKPRLVLVTNPETKKSIIAAALEAGPAPWTGIDGGNNNDPKQGWSNPQEGTPLDYKGRVSGFPPKAFKAMGMTSADQRINGKGPDLLYAWAPDQSAKPGPTDLSVDGSQADTNSKGNCSCTTEKKQDIGLGGDVDKFLKVLAFQESGGDPNQPGSSGGARGKYQYIDSTWKSSADSYYKPALKYPTANQAPESVQDAVAFLEYTKKFKDLNNDLFKLAVSHFYPAANSNPGLLDQKPPSNVITPRQYAQKLIGTIKTNGKWQDIPLKYTDAPEFDKYAKGAGGTSDSASQDSTGQTVSDGLCATEQSADTTDGKVGDFSWPLPKKFWDSQRGDFLKPHHTYPAADIPIAPGTSVYSITSGKVKSAGNNGDAGFSVFIDYNGVEFGYFHGTPGSIKVKAGDTVRSGQLIMKSGYSGHVIPAGPGGAHLHVNVRVNGVNSCPQDIFKAMGQNKSPDLTKLRTSGCSY